MARGREPRKVCDMISIDEALQILKHNIPDPNVVECFFCKEIFEVMECSRCGNLIFGETEDIICRGCWEEIYNSN